MEVQLAIASLLAGMLTILAPCVLPVLPIIVAGSANDIKNRRKPIIITASLMISVIVFTLLLRASTTLIDVPASFWTYLSGFILISFGFITIFPQAWDWLSLKLNLSTKSNRLLDRSSKKRGISGDILIGASLGPVFASCSPTYAVIVGIAINGNFAAATIYLVMYALGLGMVMMAIALAGQALIRRLGWATDPHGWFKRIVGIVFIAVGVMIISGFDKAATTWVLDGGFYDWIIQIESYIYGGDQT